MSILFPLMCFPTKNCKAISMRKLFVRPQYATTDFCTQLKMQSVSSRVVMGNYRFWQNFAFGRSVSCKKVNNKTTYTQVVYVKIGQLLFG